MLRRNLRGVRGSIRISHHSTAEDEWSPTLYMPYGVIMAQPRGRSQAPTTFAAQACYEIHSADQLRALPGSSICQRSCVEVKIAWIFRIESHRRWLSVSLL
jgi:hypothetical protein